VLLLRVTDERDVVSVFALVGALECALGLLLGYLGYALLTKRGEQVRPYQTRLGYLAIGLGVWALFETLFFFLFAPGSVVVQ
jgi:hypothetical protein